MEHKRDTLLWASLAAASALLALDPLNWLWISWQDPSYQSYGAVYCLALLAMVGLSVASGPAQGPRCAKQMFLLFLAAAALRLAGQMLAINVVSALSLALDVFALATVCRLNQRRFALSPGWMAVFFLFALPLAPILQRVAGFPLQLMSADLACRFMSPFFSNLRCDGVRLRVNDIDVMVDLPCSGATGLLLLVSVWTFLNILYRPALLPALRAGVLVLCLGIVGNALRISMLASGLAIGIDTMTPLLHTGIGLFTTGITAGLLVALYRPAPAKKLFRESKQSALPTSLNLPIAALVLIAAFTIINAPKTPVDTSAPVATAELPSQLLGERALQVPLSPTEAHYFTAYGGTAQKMQYGPLGLNVVRTTSPLRHLHSPATCLLGMGYAVRFLGTRFDPLPTSVYEATGPDGQIWTVAVSFVSSDGQRTASVGEAVWSWLNGASRTWQSVQRITPKSLPPGQVAAFEKAALAALDL